jgi:hypothetical protein
VHGNAEGDDIHPYPMSSQGGYLYVEHEDGNSFFRQRGRHSNGDSIVYFFDTPDGLVEGGKYNVSVKIRIQSDKGVASRIDLRSYFKTM